MGTGMDVDHAFADEDDEPPAGWSAIVEPLALVRVAVVSDVSECTNEAGLRQLQCPDI
jgi:hypothetical protein